jgi:hypothetical protein
MATMLKNSGGYRVCPAAFHVAEASTQGHPRGPLSRDAIVSRLAPHTGRVGLPRPSALPTSAPALGKVKLPPNQSRLCSPGTLGAMSAVGTVARGTAPCSRTGGAAKQLAEESAVA